MMVDDVVCGPHPLVRGNGDQQLAARFQHARNAFECCLVVRNVLDDVQCRDHVVPIVRDSREFGQRRGKYLMTQPLFCQASGDVIDLERID